MKTLQTCCAIVLLATTTISCSSQSSSSTAEPEATVSEATVAETTVSEPTPIDNAEPAQNQLVITGSSTVAPLALEIGKRFESLHPGIRVDVQTGG